MVVRPGTRPDINQILIKNRWFLVGLIATVTIVRELFERMHRNQMFLDGDLVSDFLIEALLIPLLLLVVLKLLHKTTVKQIRAANQLSQKEAFGHLINTAPNWNELVRVIVEFPRSFIPLSGAALALVDPRSGQYVLEELRGFFDVHQPPLVTQIESNSLCANCESDGAEEHLHRCQCPLVRESNQVAAQIVLPLKHAGTKVGLLYLFLPPEVTLSEDQEALLNSIAAEMALALDDARSKQVNSELQQKTEAERRQIARDLHDNMAQNLIYVRQKMDQLALDESVTAQPALERDLQRMRGAIEDVYLAVRSTLREIENNTYVDLAQMVDEYVQTANEQLDFPVRLNCQGHLKPVPKRTAKQVLYILGELFANIEKHAGASLVEVSLECHNDLILRISDNGRGFDFHKIAPDNHLGLAIIHERAKELNGRLNIHSAPGSGTEVVLRLPAGSLI